MGKSKPIIIVLVIAVAAGLVAAYLNGRSSEATPQKPLRKVTRDEQIPALIKGLMENEYQARKTAVIGLVAYTGVDFGYNPNQLEEERDAAARLYEAWWNAVKDKSGDERLFAAIQLDNCTNRAAIIRALSDRKYPPVLEYARKNAADKSVPPDVRLQCIAALGKFKDQIASDEITALIDMVKLGSDDEAVAAASALGEIGDNRAADALVESLRRPHLGLKAAAALAIAKVSPERAEDAFLMLLYEKELLSKAIGLEGLAQFGTTRAVPMIIEELDGALKTKARAALAHIAGVDLGYDKDAWKKHFEK
jgi:hypothetical protein